MSKLKVSAKEREEVVRSDKERKETISALKDIKKYLGKFGPYNYNRHTAVDSMIRVISEQLNESEIYKIWKNDESSGFESAMAAKDYLEGILENSDIIPKITK